MNTAALGKRVQVVSNVNLALLPAIADEHEEQVSWVHDPYQNLSRRMQADWEPLGPEVRTIWLHPDWNYPGLIPEALLHADGLLDHIRSELDHWHRRIVEHPELCWLISAPFFSSQWDEGNTWSMRSAALQAGVLEAMLQRWQDLPQVTIIRWDRWVIETGEDAVRDDRLWVVARSPYSRKFMGVLAQRVASVIARIEKSPCKVLAVDLDDTLWGGVLDEEGVEGVRLGNDGEGFAFLQFQQCLSRLRERGVLLALITRNDPEPVMAALEKHPAMLLRASSFAAILANWLPKSESLQRLSQQLGLGLESIVFLDNSPQERAEVRLCVPEVACPEMPEDPSGWCRWMHREVIPSCFDPRVQTREDKLRAASYQIALQREQERKAAGTEVPFLESLSIILKVCEASTVHQDRIRQMLERCNQFILNKDPEIHRTLMNPGPSRRVRLWEYQDRFGHEGIVGMLAWEEGETPMVQGMAISCRVLGRGVEAAMLLDLHQNLGSRTGYGLLWQDTGRNHRIRAFFEDLGVDLSQETPVLTFTEKNHPFIQQRCSHCTIHDS